MHIDVGKMDQVYPYDQMHMSTGWRANSTRRNTPHARDPLALEHAKLFGIQEQRHACTSDLEKKSSVCTGVARSNTASKQPKIPPIANRPMRKMHRASRPAANPSQREQYHGTVCAVRASALGVKMR